MKIVSFSYGSIVNGKSYGMTKALLPEYERLKSKYNYDITHYVPACSGYTGNVKIKKISSLYIFIHRPLSLAGKIFKIPSYVIRHYSLLIFDLFACSKVRKPEIIITMQFLPKTLQKNKKIGGTNILIMGNPSPEHVYNLMKDLQEKYDVIIKDAYTYKPFIIGRWKGSKSYFDSIICGTNTMKNTFEASLQSIIVTAPMIEFKQYALMEGEEYQKKTIKEKQKIRFCFLSHTVWLKGLHILLEAWEALGGVNAELHIGGRVNSQYMEWIEQRFSGLKSVVFHGRVTSLKEFYTANDVFICPSLADAGPATILEALSCGLPVICSDGCGFSEVIESGYNGFVFRVGDTSNLQKHMLEYIENPEIIKEMSQNAFSSFHEAPNSNTFDYAQFLHEHLLNLIKSK